MALILRNGGSQSPDRWLREPRNNQDKSKLKRNAVPSVAARVANLSEFCGEITVESISDQFIAAFDMEPLDKAFDKKKLNDLEQKYSSANWIFRGQK